MRLQEGNSGQNASQRPPLPNASSLFPSLSSSSSSQVPLSLNIPPPPSGPPSGLGISGLAAGRSLSAGAGSHLAQARYSLPSPLPSALSSSSTPSSSSPSQFNPHFRVQSPFGTPVDASSGWQIPRGSAPSILSPALMDFPPRGRELPLPAGFGLAPAAQPAQPGYDYHLMVSSVRGSSGLANEFPSAVPPLEAASSGTVLPPFYGGNASGGEPSSSASLPPFGTATAASYAYNYGLPPHHQAMQQQPGSAPPSRANSQSRNDTTGSSGSSSPKSLSPASPVGAQFAASASFKMQLEGGGGYEFGMERGSGAAGIVEQGQQWP